MKSPAVAETTPTDDPWEATVMHMRFRHSRRVQPKSSAPGWRTRGSSWFVAFALVVVAGFIGGGWWFDSHLGSSLGSLAGPVPGAGFGLQDSSGDDAATLGDPFSGIVSGPSGAGSGAMSGAASGSGSETAPALPKSGPATWSPPIAGRIIAAYGWRYSDVLGDWRLHAGWDIAASSRLVIRAPRLARVIKLEDSQLWEHEVTLDLGGGWTAVYRGLGSVTVTVGDSVQPGAVLGTLSSAVAIEKSESSHLHWEVRKDGVAVDPATLPGIAESSSEALQAAPDTAPQTSR